MKHVIDLDVDPSLQHLLTTAALPPKQKLSTNYIAELSTDWHQEKELIKFTKLKQHQLHILVRRGLLATGVREAKTRFYKPLPGVAFKFINAAEKSVLLCLNCQAVFWQANPKQRFCSRKCGTKNRKKTTD